MTWKKDKKDKIENELDREFKNEVNEMGSQSSEKESSLGEEDIKEGKEDSPKENAISEEIVKELLSTNKRMEEENKKLQNELDTFKDRLLRTTAEYENFRKRTVKEKEGIYGDACEDVLKYIFPGIDNLERASAVEGNIEDIKKGIEMTIRQFEDGLQKLGVEQIPASGEFDPNFHNAVMHVEDESFGKNAVVEVFQKGYKKGDKVLRYSMVKVAN